MLNAPLSFFARLTENSSGRRRLNRKTAIITEKQLPRPTMMPISSVFDLLDDLAGADWVCKGGVAGVDLDGTVVEREVAEEY